MKVSQESLTTSMELEKGQEKQVETSNDISVDWSEDVDLEFFVGENPIDTCSSSSEEKENSLRNMKERSGKTAENYVIMQNDDLNPNLGDNAINSRIKLSEGCQWSSLFTKLRSNRATYSNFAPETEFIQKITMH